MNYDSIIPKMGEVYFINFHGVNSEQSGWRPGLIIQNNTGNLYSPNIIALPLTSSLKKLNQPTHVLIHAIDSGLEIDSMVLCENPVCISKKCIGKFITTLSDNYMQKVSEAFLISTPAISFIDMEKLESIIEYASKLNMIEAYSS